MEDCESEEINEADVYTEEGVFELSDDGLLSPDEEAFMLGYLEE